MFLNFYFDVRLIESEITSELSMIFYNAQVSTAKVVCLVSGGLVLSILVDTFISKISLPMQPVPEIGSISVA